MPQKWYIATLGEFRFKWKELIEIRSIGPHDWRQSRACPQDWRGRRRNGQVGNRIWKSGNEMSRELPLNFGQAAYRQLHWDAHPSSYFLHKLLSAMGWPYKNSTNLLFHGKPKNAPHHAPHQPHCPMEMQCAQRKIWALWVNVGPAELRAISPVASIEQIYLRNY